MRKKVLVLLLSVLLLSSVLAVPMQVNAEGVDTSYPPDDGTDNFSFEITETDTSVKLTDFGFADSEEIFSEIAISVQGSEKPHPDDTNGFADGVQSYEEFSIIIEEEEKRFSIEQKGSNHIWVNMTLGDGTKVDTWKGGSTLTLALNDSYLNMDWQSSTEFKMSSRDKRTVLTYDLGEGGSVESQVSESSQFGRRDVLTDIAVGRDGQIQGGINKVSTEVKKAEKGDVELTISGDYQESKIIHLNLSRELIGSEMTALEDIKASIDGDEIPYIRPKKLHTDTEQGYYVNITEDHVHVYLRMQFSTHTVNIYEDIQNDPPASASMMGLLIGGLVVVVAAVALFRKKRR